MRCRLALCGGWDGGSWYGRGVTWHGDSVGSVCLSQWELWDVGYGVRAGVSEKIRKVTMVANAYRHGVNVGGLNSDKSTVPSLSPSKASRILSDYLSIIILHSRIR